MKKTYIIPAMETIVLKMNCQMLAGSTNAPLDETPQNNEDALVPGLILGDF